MIESVNMDNNQDPLNPNPNYPNPNPGYVDPAQAYFNPSPSYVNPNQGYVNPNPNPVYIPPTLAPEAKGPKKGLFYTILVLILIAGAAYGTYSWQHQKIVNLNSQITSIQKLQAATVQKASQSSSSSDICSIDSKPVELYCVNDSGNDVVTYSLPTLGGKSINMLVPYEGGQDYIASNGSTSALWLLSSKLVVLKKLQFPSGLSYATTFASWAHNGKSIFFELDGNNSSGNVSRQIYQYVISSNTYKQLTSTGLNQEPYQTANGDILYLNDSGSDWAPYLMDANGSNPQALNSLLYNQPPYTAGSNSFDSYNYDAATDTVFVSNYTNSGTGSNITYSTINGLLNNTAPQVQTFNDFSACESGSNILRISTNYIVCSLVINPDLDVGSVVNLTSGYVPAVISPYNNPVGLITTAP
jgi:hypothetical protein